MKYVVENLSAKTLQSITLRFFAYKHPSKFMNSLLVTMFHNKYLHFFLYIRG